MIESIMFGIFMFSSWIAIISLITGCFAHALGI